MQPSSSLAYVDSVTGLFVSQGVASQGSKTYCTCSVQGGRIATVLSILHGVMGLAM
jgi:hypothetical protein